MTKLDLRRNIQSVPLTKEDGTDAEFKLQALLASERDAYLDVLRTRMKESGKSAELTSFKGMQSELVSMCLLDEQGNPVSKETIQGWPAIVVDTLFKECQRMNSLGDSAKDAKDDAGKG